jgi:hypothetical protein
VPVNFDVMPQEGQRMPTEIERIEPSFGEGPIQPPSSSAPALAAGTSSPSPAARKVPLSRAPGKKKLLVAVPMALVCGGAYVLGQWPLAQMFFIAFLAYALVGLVEVMLGGSLLRASEAWAQLRWWQRGLASIVIVIGSIALVVTAIPALLK